LGRAVARGAGIVSTDLKPCPCCGGEAKSIRGGNGAFYTVCLGCGLRTDFDQTPESASVIWNRRVERKDKTLKARAPQPKKTEDSPWIEWTGGDMPVAPETRVIVEWPNGAQWVGYRADQCPWNLPSRYQVLSAPMPEKIAERKHYPEEWGPSNDRRLTCICGNPDPNHVVTEQIAEECAANGTQGCVIGPYGPNGEDQCKYCGESRKKIAEEALPQSEESRIKELLDIGKKCGFHPYGVYADGEAFINHVGRGLLDFAAQFAALKAREPAASASMDEKAAEIARVVHTGLATRRSDKLAWIKSIILETMQYAQSQRELPIPMILHCPKCGVQHIDAPDKPPHVVSDDIWMNPPHRSHLCHACAHIWRPADVPTIGVQEIGTKGKTDSPAPEQAKSGPWRIAKTSCSCNREDAGHGWALLKDSRMVWCLGCLTELLEQATNGDEAKDSEYAALYRWLREQDWDSSPLAVVTRPKESLKLGFDAPSRSRLDEAIRAAMKEEEPPDAKT
jgi:hypothetical protein